MRRRVQGVLCRAAEGFNVIRVGKMRGCVGAVGFAVDEPDGSLGLEPLAMELNETALERVCESVTVRAGGGARGKDEGRRDEWMDGGLEFEMEMGNTYDGALGRVEEIRASHSHHSPSMDIIHASHPYLPTLPRYPMYRMWCPIMGY